MKTWIGALAAGGLLACMANAYASYGLDEVSTERLKDAAKIAPLQIDGAFGDQVSLYNGALSFENVDISLPGHGPAVEFRRSLSIDDNPMSGDIGGLGNWSVDVPEISGVFAESYGWVVKGNSPQARCSSGTAPVDTQGFANYEYWDGNTLSVPGQVSEKVLVNTRHNRPQPTNGVTYPWTTKSGWLLSCKTVSGNEVFVATSPDGTRYHLERSVTRDYPDLAYNNVIYSWDGSTFKAAIGRLRIHYVATLVEDRHGNTVTYSYDASGRPTKIQGSDGRLITIDYAGTDKVQSITAAGKTYRYSYTGNYLTEVKRPDLSTWTYTSGSPSPITHFYDFEIPNPSYCRVPDFDGGGFVFTVKNPSNAQGRFELQGTRHRRQNVPEACIWSDGGRGLKPTHWRIPLYFDTVSLIKKDISGPGVVAGTWTYNYSNFAMPSGFQTQCGSQTPSPCPLTKKNTVTGPETYEVYEYGIWWEVNDGQLISHSVGRDASSTLTKTTNTYVSEQEAATLPFGVFAGGPNGAYYDQLNDRQRPVRQAAIDQQGVTFKTVTNSWDVFARPVSVTRSSTISDTDVPPRTDVTTYYDDLNLWVTGQVASVTNLDLNKVLERTTFNSKAMPYQTFGPRGVDSTSTEVAEHTFEYFADGTAKGAVKSVTDGLGNKTQYSSWMRGVPQMILLPATPEKPAGATIESLVETDGTITWLQGEGGGKTCYTYDAMGRTKTITLPSETTTKVCDTSAWNMTSQEFVESGENFGLPAKHWRQTVTTGNARTDIHFDAFWRPVVEVTYSLTGDAALTYVVKRYDALGRLVFQSYPRGSLSDYRATLNGVTTTYDALGRPLTVTQDSELGPLLTTTSYLTGFQTKVTNPRGKVTTTGFFAQGEPSVDKPVWIDQPEAVYTTIKRDALGNPRAVSRSGPGG